MANKYRLLICLLCVCTSQGNGKWLIKIKPKAKRLKGERHFFGSWLGMKQKVRSYNVSREYVSLSPRLESRCEVLSGALLHSCCFTNWPSHEGQPELACKMHGQVASKPALADSQIPKSYSLPIQAHNLSNGHYRDSWLLIQQGLGSRLSFSHPIKGGEGEGEHWIKG